MSIEVRENSNGYIITKEWPMSGAVNTIIATKEELKDLLNILVDIENNK